MPTRIDQPLPTLPHTLLSYEQKDKDNGKNNGDGGGFDDGQVLKVKNDIYKLRRVFDNHDFRTSIMTSP